MTARIQRDTTPEYRQSFGAMKTGLAEWYAITVHQNTNGVTLRELARFRLYGRWPSDQQIAEFVWMVMNAEKALLNPVAAAIRQQLADTQLTVGDVIEVTHIKKLTAGEIVVLDTSRMTCTEFGFREIHPGWQNALK